MHYIDCPASGDGQGNCTCRKCDHYSYRIVRDEKSKRIVWLCFDCESTIWREVDYV